MMMICIYLYDLVELLNLTSLDNADRKWIRWFHKNHNTEWWLGQGYDDDDGGGGGSGGCNRGALGVSFF